MRVNLKLYFLNRFRRFPKQILVPKIPTKVLAKVKFAPPQAIINAPPNVIQGERQSLHVVLYTAACVECKSKTIFKCFVVH